MLVIIKIIWCPIKELVELICKSKIVLNFSKTTWDRINNFPEKNLFFNQYQLKGRIIQVGFVALLVFQNMPTHELLYNSNELIQFKSKKECLFQIQDLLNNSKKLEEYSKIFSAKTKNFYEEEKNLKNI